MEEGSDLLLCLVETCRYVIAHFTLAWANLRRLHRHWSDWHVYLVKFRCWGDCPNRCLRGTLVHLLIHLSHHLSQVPLFSGTRFERFGDRFESVLQIETGFWAILLFNFILLGFFETALHCDHRVRFYGTGPVDDPARFGAGFRLMWVLNYLHEFELALSPFPLMMNFSFGHFLYKLVSSPILNCLINFDFFELLSHRFDFLLFCF